YAGDKTAVSANQMLAARAHAARVMNSSAACRAPCGLTAWAKRRHDAFPGEARAASLAVARIADRDSDDAAAAADVRLRQDRPFEEFLQTRVAVDCLLHERLLNVRWRARADRLEAAAERIISGAAIADTVAPHEVALPEEHW